MTMHLCIPPSGQHHSAIRYSHIRGLQALRVLLMLGAVQAMASGPLIAAAAATVHPEESRMWMTVGERRFAITLADTEAARAFSAMLPLSIDMADLNRNEKYADLPKALPTSASRPGTIRNGDLMLYGSRTLVVFYLIFDSSYSYTRIGSVDDPADLSQALGRGDVRIEFKPAME